MRPLAIVAVMAVTSVLVAVGLAPLFGSAGAAVKAVDSKFLAGTDEKLTLPALAQRSTIYAADGSVLATVYRGENRVVFPFSSFNQYTRDAVLAIEDHSFYQHGAVDVTAIMRALLANIRAGHVVQGGSTIDQQLIKNTQTGSEQTIQRKILEAHDALRLEQTYTKNEILAEYLNTIYMGNGVYGVGTAAQYYFNKPPQKLNLAQAALLAGLIASPEGNNPIANPDTAFVRRNEVLGQMLLYGFIDQHRYDIAAKVPIKLSDEGRKTNQYGPEPYWVDYVKSQFLSDPAFGRTRAQREQFFYQGGLQIHTTLQPRLQKVARVSLATRYPDPTDPQSAVVTLNARTGAIMAMVDGNETYGLPKNPKDLYQLPVVSQVNYAISGRSTGSSFKGYTLAAALDQGISPAAVFKTDSPITIKDCGGTGVNWTVSNAEGGGKGFASLWTATADSINVVFAQLINIIKPQSVEDMAHRMGVRSPLLPVCSMTLGTLGTTPLDQATGYSTLANNGIHCMTFAISKITDSAGATIYEHQTDCTRAIPAEVAAQESAMLEGVIAHGTGTKARLSDGRPEAGKTGTAENYSNAWFVGYVPQVVTAVWVGYAKGDAIPMLNVHGYKGFGGDLAAPVWHDVMDVATAHLPVMDFPTPPPQKLSRVPNVVGKSEAEATKILLAAKFAPASVQEDSVAPKGTVFQQEPAGGASAPLGTLVIMHVSTGKAPVAVVPNVIGQSEAAARQALTTALFLVSASTKDTKDPKKDGIVIGQSPQGGTKSVVGKTVSIVVGKYVKTTPPPTTKPPPTTTAAPPVVPGPGGGADGGVPAWLIGAVLLPVGLLPVWRWRGRRRPPR